MPPQIPSHLFEYFARSKSMLQAWAGVPGDLVEEALAERDQFGRMELQSQLLYSAADQVRAERLRVCLSVLLCNIHDTESFVA